MKCENIRELMSAYIDNEINEVDKAKFDKHIAQCPQCKEEYELLKRLVLECSEIDEAELPEDFREELHNKLLEAKSANKNKFSGFIRRNKWRVAGGTAAAVLILAISLSSLNAPKYSDQSLSSPAPAAYDRGQFGSSYDMDQNGAAMNKGMAAAGAPETAAAPAEAPNVEFSQSMPEGRSADQNQIQMFTTADTAPEQVRKIIKNGNVSLKVKDVQTRIQEITALTNQSGGYVESSYVDNIVQPNMEIDQDSRISKETTTMVANMTIRIPADRFEGSFQKIIAMGKLVNQSTNSSDVTSQYRDIEARVENLKVQEKNLQEIMTKATNVEDTLKVETELNRVRTEIDLMTGNLKNWDRLVEYSTIFINMTEVKEAELEKVDVPGVWDNAKQGFISTINGIRNGLERLFVFMVSALPYIVIIGLGSLLAVIWIKKRKNKKE